MSSVRFTQSTPDLFSPMSVLRTSHLILLALASLLHVSQSRIDAKEVDLTPVRNWIEAQSKLNTLYGTFEQERKMSTVKRVFKKNGEFWYDASGKVCWQIGKDDGDYVAVKNDSEVLILQPKKRKMKRYPIEELKNDEKLQGISFVEAGFPRSLADFQRGFQVTKITKEDGYYSVETKIRNGRASLALTKLVFYIHESDFQLKAFKMFFRDKSTIYNRFTRLFPNKAIDSTVFSPSTEGYTLLVK